MAGESSDYQHGAQDVREQQATFRRVMGMTKWGCLALAVFLLFVVLWLCTPTFGFMGGAAASVVLLILGVMFLREKPTEAH